MAKTWGNEGRESCGERQGEYPEGGGSKHTGPEVRRGLGERKGEKEAARGVPAISMVTEVGGVGRGKLST